MTERTIEECLENCLRLAKNSLEVYDEMEKHNVSYAEMYRAKRTGTLLDYCYQRELKAGTAFITTLMSIDDFVDDVSVEGLWDEVRSNALNLMWASLSFGKQR